MREYLVIVEEGRENFSAYLPDVPGCVATGRTRSETLRRLRSALRMHLAALAEDGTPPPAAVTRAEYVAVEE